MAVGEREVQQHIGPKLNLPAYEEPFLLWTYERSKEKQRKANDHGQICLGWKVFGLLVVLTYLLSTGHGCSLVGLLCFLVKSA